MVERTNNAINSPGPINFKANPEACTSDSYEFSTDHPPLGISMASM